MGELLNKTEMKETDSGHALQKAKRPPSKNGGRSGKTLG